MHYLPIEVRTIRQSVLLCRVCSRAVVQSVWELQGADHGADLDFWKIASSLSFPREIPPQRAACQIGRRGTASHPRARLNSATNCLNIRAFTAVSISLVGDV